MGKKIYWPWTIFMIIGGWADPCSPDFKIAVSPLTLSDKALQQFTVKFSHFPCKNLSGQYIVQNHIYFVTIWVTNSKDHKYSATTK